MDGLEQDVFDVQGGAVVDIELAAASRFVLAVAQVSSASRMRSRIDFCRLARRPLAPRMSSGLSQSSST